MAADLVIECKDLAYRYPNGVEALKGIDLEIHKGEYIAFVGQNGSGKTTLVKHFVGLLKPNRGEVKVNGVSTSSLKVSALSRQVGYVFQNPDDMLFSSSVEEEIAFGPRMVGMKAEEIKPRVEKVLVELGLESLRTEHPFALSLGDRQRVAVACALALLPEAFVFDEPTTGQDHFGGNSIMGLIDMLHARGNTVIIITHDMNLVAEHAHRVVVMNQGRIALEGTPEFVFTKPEKLQELSLKSPQVTLLARRLGCTDRVILTVKEMKTWLEDSYFKKSAVVKGART
jgi:energy-coupling factor transporter ATP-binding protein EcfA2